MNDIAPKLDPKVRASIEGQLAGLTAAEARLDALMEPLRQQMAPYQEVVAQLHELRTEILAAHGLELADESCEGCGKVLFVGDLAHKCSDGPVLCEACAPTYADCLLQMRETLAEDEAHVDPAFKMGEDDRRELEEAVTATMANVAAGCGDEKAVLPL